LDAPDWLATGFSPTPAIWRFLAYPERHFVAADGLGTGLTGPNNLAIVYRAITN
jgi:hypothetical protein